MDFSIDTLKDIYQRPEHLEPAKFNSLLDEGIRAAELQSPDIRPRDRRGLPGGILFLNGNKQKKKPVIIIPDLHARMDFILSVMNYPLDGQKTVLEALERDECIVVCVGDGFHGEARVRQRWQKAFQEYSGNYKKHEAMDEEMRESLGLLEMILHLRIRFPENFYFLKGNHENIANEGIEGNYPFGKFVREGEMVTHWVNMFLGGEVFRSIYLYEKTLPILAICDDFIVTHAEPARVYSENDIINCYLEPEVIYAFTWTDNNAAEEDSVSSILDNFFPGKTNTVMFGGHRPIKGNYNLRAGGRYIQLHNPDNFIIAVIDNMDFFDIDKNIFVIPESL